MKPELKMKHDGSVKVFDFFSGCGGASCGFRNAGMEIVFALDCDDDAKRTFETNFPDARFEHVDIRNVSVRAIRELMACHRPAPILFCGCAPCQPFTKQNTIQPAPSADDRVPLLSYFTKLVEDCKPDVVFFENVPGIQRIQHGSQPFARFVSSLERSGYTISRAEAVPLMQYGVPQSRRRLVLLISRHGPIDLPPPTHGPGRESPYVTVRDTIADLPPIAVGEVHPEILNHRAAGLSELNLRRIRETGEGGGHREWPESLRLTCHIDTDGHSDVYGRMWWDRPASGLTTRCVSYSNGRFGHPNQDRAISIREAACLQTFPREFEFKGGLGSMARQIGNAVPPRMTELAGVHFNRHLRDHGVLL